ncbi:hypothetical protein ACF08N_36385 [Streptomyces sp. NPDC015127]|uniref:hypothetical protein n=1 Tax=Streptomyces sp. NPDC015127 TaxID=3364939 RepID=UPI0036FC130A
MLLIVSEMLEGAFRHRAPAVFMELAHPGGQVALAFRDDSVDPAAAGAVRLAAEDLKASLRCRTHLTVLDIPGELSTMFARVGRAHGVAA